MGRATRCSPSWITSSSVASAGTTRGASRTERSDGGDAGGTTWGNSVSGVNSQSSRNSRRGHFVPTEARRRSGGEPCKGEPYARFGGRLRETGSDHRARSLPYYGNRTLVVRS